MTFVFSSQGPLQGTHTFIYRGGTAVMATFATFLFMVCQFVTPACVCAADTPPGKSPVFTNVTKQADIAFQHSFGDRKMSNIVEATGAGCCFFDYDRDGFIDLYVVNGATLPEISSPDAPRQTLTNRLFRNNGNGTFSDVTTPAGVGDTGYGMGCTAADYDNDGDTDLYVTNYGKNVFYRNNGDGTFSDFTDKAGVACPLWSVGTAFFDYNNDGLLDLFVGNYLQFDPQYRLYYEADEFPGPLSYTGQHDVLYRNRGDGTFDEVTKTAGITKAGRAMGVLAADYNADGFTDIFVANDAMENYLYHNNGDGTFRDVGLEAGVAFSQYGDATSSMGGDFGDIDLDGDLDLMVPDMTFNSMYMNLGRGLFADASARLGIAELSGQYWSWGGDFFDYDNDGDLDLFISNGNGHRLDTQEVLFLVNTLVDTGSLKFIDIGEKAGEFFRYKSVSRGMATADYDNDGDLDVFLVTLDQPSIMLRNDGGNGNNWISIALEGTRSNRDGIGSRVSVRCGERTQTEERRSGTSYLSQNDPRLYFGVGKIEVIDEITINWSRGTVQKLEKVTVNQLLTIKEPATE